MSQEQNNWPGGRSCPDKLGQQLSVLLVCLKSRLLRGEGPWLHFRANKEVKRPQAGTFNTKWMVESYGENGGIKSRWAMKPYRHIRMEKEESALEYHSEFKLDTLQGDSLQSSNEMGFSSKNTVSLQKGGCSSDKCPKEWQ